MSNEDLITLRVAVGTPEGPRSGTWRIWTNKSDVYVGVRSLSGMFKVSLHDGGACIAAFTSELARKVGGEEFLPRGTRRRDSWRRPTHLSGSQVVPFVVLIPSVELRVHPLGSDKDTESILWLPTPAFDRCVSLNLVFGDGDPGRVRWTVGVDPGRTIASCILPNGETFWVVESTEPLTQVVSEAIVGRQREVANSQPTWQLRPIDPTNPAARLILAAEGADEKRVFVDAALTPAA